MTAGAQQPISAIAGDSAVTPPSTLDNRGRPAGVAKTPPRCVGLIIMAGRNGSFFNVAGYLIEEKRRWPVITASPRGQCSK